MAGGPGGGASSCSCVRATSPESVPEAASTGKAATILLLTSPAFSVRYLPDVTARLRPSSRASASGSTAAIRTGSTQPTVKPGLDGVVWPEPAPAPLAVDQHSLPSATW